LDLHNDCVRGRSHPAARRIYPPFPRTKPIIGAADSVRPRLPKRSHRDLNRMDGSVPGRIWCEEASELGVDFAFQNLERASESGRSGRRPGESVVTAVGPAARRSRLSGALLMRSERDKML